MCVYVRVHAFMRACLRERLGKFSVLFPMFQPRGYSPPLPEREFLISELVSIDSMIC